MNGIIVSKPLDDIMNENLSVNEIYVGSEFPSKHVMDANIEKGNYVVIDRVCMNKLVKESIRALFLCSLSLTNLKTFRSLRPDKRSLVYDLVKFYRAGLKFELENDVQRLNIDGIDVFDQLIPDAVEKISNAIIQYVNGNVSDDGVISGTDDSEIKRFQVGQLENIKDGGQAYIYKDKLKWWYKIDFNIYLPAGFTYTSSTPMKWLFGEEITCTI